MSTYYYNGAVVLGSNMSLGWNEQQTSLTIKVAEDPLDPFGSSFVAPTPGTPSIFQLGAFSYAGIVRSVNKSVSTSGAPTFDIILTDPKDIMDIPVILSGYYQPSIFSYNLLNVFGYLENTGGFGYSGHNDSGIPWTKLVAALGQMMSTQNLYGGPIVFGNVTYIVNFNDAGLLGAPPYYRIGGGTNTMTLKELISAYCEEAGLDYYCYLTPPIDGDNLWVINIVTESRKFAPPLGTIDNYVSQNTGDVLNYESGLEWANQITSTVITGGQKTDLFFATNIRPYWGKDIDGNIINSYLESIRCPDWPAAEKAKKNGQDSYDENGIPRFPQYWRYINNGALYTKANLNATPISKYIGSTIYPIDDLELRAAREDMGTWRNFVYNVYPYKAAAIGPEGMNGNVNIFQNPKGPADAVRWVGQAAMAGNVGDLTSKQADAEIAVYNFVRAYAEEFYGKKFLVGIPFMFSATDSETGQIKYSHEPVDSAWYEDYASLGLTNLDSYYFRTPDEKFMPFAYFSNTITVDKERINPGDAICYYNKMYLKASINTQILSVSNAPYVLVTLAAPLYSVDDNVTGNEEDLRRALIESGKFTNEQIDNQGGARAFAKLRQQPPSNGDMDGITLSPPIYTPNVIAVPLKSNILCYGPWKAQSSTLGKVRYEQDESLVPWQYGSYAAMEQAANAKVWNGLSTMEIAERGRITRAGIPLVNLGQALVEGGPAVTGMNISCSKDGLTTSYEFRTFSPKLNTPDKGAVDRIRRIGLAAQKARRDMVTNARRREIGIEAVVDAKRAREQRKAVWQRRKTPHDCLIAKVMPQETDEDGNTTDDMRITVSTVDILEGRMLASMYEEDIDSVALTSTSAIMRPYSTYDNEFMPSIVVPTGSAGLKSIDFLQISREGHDIEVGTQNEFSGWNQYREPVNTGYQRSIGYAMNNAFIGWGYSIYDQKRTADIHGSVSGSSVFRQSNIWHAGPMDSLWDKIRGCWTSHDILLGVTNQAISGGSSGNVTLYNGTSKLSYSGQDVIVSANIWYTGASVPSGKRVTLAYTAHANKLFIIGADC